MQDLQSSEDHGWEKEDGYLKLVYMKGPAPRSLVELTRVTVRSPSVKAIARAQIQASPVRRRARAWLTKRVKTRILQPCISW